MSKDKSPNAIPTPKGGASSLAYAARTCARDMKTAAQAIELVAMEIEDMTNDDEIPDTELSGVLVMTASFLRNEARISEELVSEVWAGIKSRANNIPTDATEGGE